MNSILPLVAETRLLWSMELVTISFSTGRSFRLSMVVSERSPNCQAHSGTSSRERTM